MAGDEFSDHLALEGRHVCEHLARITEVTDGVHALHVGLAAFVYFDEATLVEGDAGGFEA